MDARTFTPTHLTRGMSCRQSKAAGMGTGLAPESKVAPSEQVMGAGDGGSDGEEQRGEGWGRVGGGNQTTCRNDILRPPRDGRGVIARPSMPGITGNGCAAAAAMICWIRSICSGVWMIRT